MTANDLRVARVIAADYAAGLNNVVNTAGGFVWLWNWRAGGWCAAIDDAKRFRPGVLFVHLSTGDLFVTVGGNYSAGAERFEKIELE